MKFLNSKIFTAGASIVVLLLALSSVNLNLQRDSVDREVGNMEAKIREVQKDMDYLNKLSDYFKTSDFLEKQARLKLNYKAQGEEVVFVYKNKNVKNEDYSISIEELLSRMSNHKKWFFYLLGY